MKLLVFVENLAAEGPTADEETLVRLVSRAVVKLVNGIKNYFYNNIISKYDSKIWI